MTCRLRWCVEMETRCRIPMWRTFGRIQWHVIPEPPATLQGAATCQIQCHDSRATCHIAGCCHRRIQWHVIPEPRITLQGTATWWIHCHDSRATCHIAGCSHLAKSTSWSGHIAGCKNSIRHIENRFSPYFIFLFLMQFRLWRAAAFVSSVIHLLLLLWKNWFTWHYVKDWQDTLQNWNHGNGGTQTTHG